MPGMPTISIIICSRNRADSLKKTLEAVERVLPEPEGSIELIVVDNGSTDGTARIIADFAVTRPKVKALHEPRPGKAIALNRAAQAATGAIIVWLDDDVVPQPGWLENLTRPILEDEADLVAGSVIMAPHLSRDWMTLSHRDRLAEIDPADGTGAIAGANLAVRKSVLEQTDGFDPRLGPGQLGFQEDSLLAHHIRSLGARVVPARNAKVEHHFDPSRLLRSSWLKSAESLGRSCGYVAFHWEHGSITYPWLRGLRKRAQLMSWRLRHLSRLDPDREGISDDELACVQHIAYLDQYRLESRKPHAYEKRGVRRKY